MAELGRVLAPYGGIEHCANIDCKRTLDEDRGAYLYRDLTKEGGTGLCVFCGDCALYVELECPDRFKLIML